MKKVFAFLTISVLVSCNQQMESTQEVPSENTAIDIANVSDTSFGSDIEKNSKINESADWQKKQDSLRNVILEGKPNEILKNSFLQEMYIRNVASVIKDCVFVNIPFDVHGPDCGAPDCYTTEISFSIKINDSLLFPENLKFQEHEYGCVDNEQKLSGTFQLLEENTDHVIYYSTKYKRTLVLFDSNERNGTTAFYFIGLGKNEINGQNVHTIMSEYNDQNENSIYPFTSWVLNTFEYEHFID